MQSSEGGLVPIDVTMRAVTPITDSSDSQREKVLARQALGARTHLRLNLISKFQGTREEVVGVIGCARQPGQLCVVPVTILKGEGARREPGPAKRAIPFLFLFSSCFPPLSLSLPLLNSLSLSLCARQGRIERQRAQWGHPLTVLPNNAQPNFATRAPPCLCVCGAVCPTRARALGERRGGRERDAALNLSAKINSPRLFMPWPPPAPPDRSA